ncbi:MAG: mechanosensitive ion channel [Acidobacteriota bacterium]|nr:mechanosensitive ion channel [Acidobacteriota bacterium]
MWCCRDRCQRRSSPSSRCTRRSRRYSFTRFPAADGSADGGGPGHLEVFQKPEPMTFVLGFGESSLDFELRAWTGTEFVQVASDLRVAVNQALEEARIEIPFPQRDLHLRSGAGSPSERAVRSVLDGRSDAAVIERDEGEVTADDVGKDK